MFCLTQNSVAQVAGRWRSTHTRGIFTAIGWPANWLSYNGEIGCGDRIYLMYYNVRNNLFLGTQPRSLVFLIWVLPIGLVISGTVQ
jgi:hypothetical protein